MAEQSQWYPVTSWSLIERVKAGQPGALAQFLLLYQPPLRAHLTSKRGMQVQDAEDALQDFIADKIIERNLIAQVKQSEGRKFRTYILLALDRFVVSLWRKASAQRRMAPGNHNIPLDEDLCIPNGELPVSEEFDLEWARMVIKQAIDRARQECVEKGQLQIWQAFDARVLGPTLNQGEPPSYADLVKRFGFKSASEAANAVLTGERKLQRCLRAVVREYTAESCVDQEIADLIAILSKSHA